MSDPDTAAMNRHFKRLVSIALEVEEEQIESSVQAVPCDDGSYICHLSVKLDGREPSKQQERAIVFTVQRYGFPGIRVTHLKIPAEA
jgi:hypothetical protein